MTYDLIPWRARYLQSAPRFEFGARAICKTRPDLHLARSLFAKRARFCIWRARYLQSASGFAFGALAICKARPDLHLARSLFAKRVRICIWRARYLQSASGFAFGMHATFDSSAAFSFYPLLRGRW